MLMLMVEESIAISEKRELYKLSEFVLSAYLLFLLKQNPETSGVVLEDFDAAFTNKFYHSHLDDLCELLFHSLDSLPLSGLIHCVVESHNIF